MMRLPIQWMDRPLDIRSLGLATCILWTGLQFQIQMYQCTDLTLSDYRSSCSIYACDESKNFTCEPATKICICKADPDGTHIFMYDLASVSCIPVPRDEKKSFLRCEKVQSVHKTAEYPHKSCKSHHECQRGLNSDHMQCNFDTCTCQCAKTDKVTRFKTTFRDWKCRISQGIGEACEMGSECEADNSFCESYNGTCQCLKHFTWNQAIRRCKFVPPLCSNHEDCRTEFGELAKCTSVSESTYGYCHCDDGSRLYQGKCIAQKKLGESCSDDLECQNGIGGNAICLNNESCSCQSGFTAAAAAALNSNDNNETDCLPVADTLDFPCLASEQCIAGLGESGRCTASGGCACSGHEFQQESFYDASQAKCILVNRTRTIGCGSGCNSTMTNEGIASYQWIIFMAVGGMLGIVLLIILLKTWRKRLIPSPHLHMNETSISPAPSSSSSVAKCHRDDSEQLRSLTANNP